MKEYFEKTLGIPASNIYFKTDSRVTKAEFEKISSKRGWLDKRADKNTDIYIYYAGHGAYDKRTKSGYWQPVNAEEKDNTEWIANDRITKILKTLPANNVFVVADSCYSGTVFRGLCVPKGNSETKVQSASCFLLPSHSNISAKLDNIATGLTRFLPACLGEEP